MTYLVVEYQDTPFITNYPHRKGEHFFARLFCVDNL